MNPKQWPGLIFKPRSKTHEIVIIKIVISRGIKIFRCR